MIQILLYLFYFVAASASPLQRRYLAVQKDADPKGQISFAFQVVLILVVGSLTFPFFSRFYLNGSAYYLVGLSLICGLSGAAYFICNYIAQKHVDAGVTNVVSNIYTPVTIILSTLLLHEGLHALQILGTILLLIALVIVSKKHHISTFRFDKYFLLMLLSGVMLGILLVAERALQKTTGFSAGTMLSWWSQCVFLGIITLLTGSKHPYSQKETIITGILRFFQGLSWVVLVFVVGNLSLVSAVTTFKIVIIFAAAAIFLKERDDMARKIFGCIIALAGLLLMK